MQLLVDQVEFANVIVGPASKGVIRSKGFLWLASVADSEWSSELDLDEIDAIWEEPWGDHRQELAIIGANLSPDLVEQLDPCCLSDAEIGLGPEGWAESADPFPAWRIATDEAEAAAEA